MPAPWKENAFCIGLTGGIASGKTTAANLLEEWGAVLVDGDVVSRELVEPGMPLLDRLADEFGEDVIQADGTLDRKKLGRIVFNDKEELAKLDSLMHPAIWEEMGKQMLEASLNHPVVVMVMPLLLEHHAEDLVHQVWVVDISRQTQVERLMNRDQSSRQDAEARIRAQMPVEEKAARADILIDNNGTLEQLRENAWRVWTEQAGPHLGSSS